MDLKKVRLENSLGMSVEIINYGGIVTSLQTPDKNGQLADIVLGFDHPSDYVKANPFYFGALVGRYANRMGGAAFKIDGKTYSLDRNDGANSLHGGLRGFDKVFWQIEENKNENSVRLSFESPDGDGGFPGRLKTEVVYALSAQGEFSIEYRAQTDQATHVNFTHHSYFNLSGQAGSTILDHDLMIDADTYTVSDEECIPTGEIRRLEPALNFKTARRVGEHIHEIRDGYNHNYILNHPGQRLANATLHHRPSGRLMEVTTTEPGLQLYTGYFLDESAGGRGGIGSPRFAGLCLEAQHYPDSPNKSSFPSTLLRAGETYHQRTSYKFSVKD